MCAGRTRCLCVRGSRVHVCREDGLRVRKVRYALEPVGGRGQRTYQPADVALALALDAVHLVLVRLVGSAQVGRLGLVGLHAIAERLLRLLACRLELQDLLLQPQALAVEGPASLFARLGQQRRLDLVGGTIAQHVQRGLQPLQLALLDLGSARCLLLVLADEHLAQRLKLLGLLLMQLGPELRDVGRVSPLLLLALQLGLLQPLAQLAHLQPRGESRSGSGLGEPARPAATSPCPFVCDRPLRPSPGPRTPIPPPATSISPTQSLPYYFVEMFPAVEKHLRVLERKVRL